MPTRRVLIDTNIFLEVLQDRARADERKQLLQLVRNGTIAAFLTDFALHGICHLLGKASRLQALDLFLTDILTYRGLQIVSGSLLDCQSVVRTGRSEGLRFDDAYQLYFSRRLGVPITSFDTHFDGRDVSRLEPRDLLP